MGGPLRFAQFAHDRIVPLVVEVLGACKFRVELISSLAGLTQTVLDEINGPLAHVHSFRLIAASLAPGFAADRCSTHHPRPCPRAAVASTTELVFPAAGQFCTARFFGLQLHVQLPSDLFFPTK